MDFDNKSRQWQEKLLLEFGKRMQTEKENERKEVQDTPRERNNNEEKEMKDVDGTNECSNDTNTDNNNTNTNNDIELKVQEKHEQIAMFTLSNIQHSKRFNKKGIKRWSQYKQFNKLYDHCCESIKRPLYSLDYVLMHQMKLYIERIKQVKRKHTKR